MFEHEPKQINGQATRGANKLHREQTNRDELEREHMNVDEQALTRGNKVRRSEDTYRHARMCKSGRSVQT